MKYAAIPANVKGAMTAFTRDAKIADKSGCDEYHVYVTSVFAITKDKRKGWPMDDTTLRDLAVRASDGDLDAAENLIRGFHGHLFSFLHLLRVPETELEDVAQDTAVRLYRSLSEYDPAQPFLPFLRGVARHAAADFWRSRHREARRLTAFQAFVVRQAGEETGERHLNVQKARLLHCLGRLQPKQREIVTLRYDRGLDSGGIARELGQSAVAVRQALSRIRRTLRACVQAAP